jgi:prephenate dehydrogenase
LCATEEKITEAIERIKNNSMNVAIIGVGLIGGSMALALREKGLATTIIGVDTNECHQQKALELGLVDKISELDAAIKDARSHNTGSACR